MNKLYVLAGLVLGCVSLAYVESAGMPDWAIGAIGIAAILIGVILYAFGDYCEKRQAHDDHMEELELQLKYQHPQGVPVAADNTSPQPQPSEKGA